MLRRVPCLRTARYPPRLPIYRFDEYHTISVSSRTAFFLSWWKVHCRFPHVRSRRVLLRIALWSMCKQTQWQDVSKNILVIQSSDSLLFLFYKHDFCSSSLSVSARKSLATSGQTPLRLGHLLRTICPRVLHRIFIFVMNNVAEYDHVRWWFSIVAGHPSLRGHHCTLRVGAPLSFTGGMKGIGWWDQKLSFLRLSSVDLSIATSRDINENTRVVTTLRLRSSYSLPVHRFYVLLINLFIKHLLSG